MQKIQKFCAGFLAVALLLPSVASADLDPMFRENFQPWVEDLCHASIEYTLDDRVWGESDAWFLTDDGKEEAAKQKRPAGKVKEWKNYKRVDDGTEEGKWREYHRLMNCLFSNAMAESTQGIKDLVEENHGSDLQQLQIFDLGDDQKTVCSEYTLENIIERQRHDGFDPENQSRCKGNDVGEEPYSACRVQEVALRELCGYQQFLLAKSVDFQSFPDEYRLDLSMRQDAGQAQAILGSMMQEESVRAEETVQVMGRLYNNFVQKYRQHSWLVALQAQVESAQQKLWRMKRAIETFADKFCNAAIE